MRHVDSSAEGGRESGHASTGSGLNVPPWSKTSSEKRPVADGSPDPLLGIVRDCHRQSNEHDVLGGWDGGDYSTVTLTTAEDEVLQLQPDEWKRGERVRAESG